MGMHSPESFKINDINEVYPLVGDGKYQLWVFAISVLATWAVGVQELILYFLALDPGWKCLPSSVNCNFNSTILSTSKYYKERCQLNRTEWTYAAGNTFSIVTEFDLYCAQEHWIETSSTIFYLGNLFGALALGWMSDRFGRSKVVFFSSTIVIAGSICSAFVKELWLFEVLRFFTGLFISGTYMVLVVLVSEITSDKLRAAAAMSIWFFYSSSTALIGLLAYYLQDWRKLLLYTTAPYAIFVVITLWFLPESFIWLHANRKEEELRKELQRIAKFNNKKMPTNIVFKWPDKEDEVVPSGIPITLLLKPRRMLMGTLCLMFAWFALGLIYFGISLAADDLTGDIYRDFSIIMMMDVPATVIAIFCSSRIGRKATIVPTMLIGSLCLAIVGFIPTSSSKSSGYASARLSLGIVGKLLTTTSFDVLIVWCAELYPTNLRSNANGLFNSISIIGSMCAPWVGIWFRQVHQSLPFFTMGGCAIISSLFLAWLPETMGKNLPQTLNSGTNAVEECNNDCGKEDDPTGNVNIF